jgi:hypothetical protein
MPEQTPAPTENKDRQPDTLSEFEQQAQTAPPSAVSEMWDFLKNNKKWWMTPIVILLLLFGLLVLLAGTGVAPFIYTLF